MAILNLIDNLDYSIKSPHSTYDGAWKGEGALDFSVNPSQVGQNHNNGVYTCFETYHRFPVGGIPTNAVISQVQHQFYVSVDNTDTNFYYQLRGSDGATSWKSSTVADNYQSYANTYINSIGTKTTTCGANIITLINNAIANSDVYINFIGVSDQFIARSAPTNNEKCSTLSSQKLIVTLEIPPPTPTIMLGSFF